ncbi:MAG: SBBP repeat-containing protein [Proteobacteria bacterium]|nr:SBBP repeat-containing protein [Pseudomonadota bacterium]
MLAMCIYLGASDCARPDPVLLGAEPGYGAIPLIFEPNMGQTAPQSMFVARGRNATLLLGAHGAQIQVARRKIQDASAAPTSYTEQAAADAGFDTASITISLAGASAEARAEALEPLPGKSHYFRGNDPAKWIVNVPQFAKVVFRDVYPGVDQVFHGDRSAFEYDLIVAPHADPSVIRLAFDSPALPNRLADGSWVFETQAGQVVHRKPVAYQMVGDLRATVDAELIPTAAGAAIRIGNYDHALPLIIDPVVEYGTYLGGSKDDSVRGVAVDAAGNAYLAGRTTSLDFPTLYPVRASNGGSDAFVTKIDAAGRAIVWSTYLGGSDTNQAEDVAVTPDGTATVTGNTLSSDFPTVNAAQPAHKGTSGNDAFVAKLKPDGSGFVYSTYLGGSGDDDARAIAVMASGEAFVTGKSGSSDFPGDESISTCKKAGMAFVTKYGSGGDKRYSICVGGTHRSNGEGTDSRSLGIAVDAAGQTYVSGQTTTIDFPTLNAVQPNKLPGRQQGGVYATFAFKLNAAGNALVYSTYIGGDHDAYGGAIAVDTAGNAYVTGASFLYPCSVYKPPCDDGQFPIVNPILGSSTSPINPFVVKIAPRGDKFIYATYLAACTGSAFWGKVAVDWAGNAYVTGASTCADAPVPGSAIVIKLDQHGDTAAYYTNVGGTGTSRSSTYGIAVDEVGSAYVAGETYRDGFTPVDPIQPNPGGPSYTTDGFIVKLLGSAPSATVNLSSSRNPADAGDPVTFTVTVPDTGGQVELREANTTLAQAALGASRSSTTLTLATLSPGRHSIVAVWTPRDSLTPQMSPALMQSIGEFECP